MATGCGGYPNLSQPNPAYLIDSKSFETGDAEQRSPGSLIENGERYMRNSKKAQSKYPVRLTDAQVRYRLYAQGFYDSWITQELINAQRKILEAQMRHHPCPKNVKNVIPGDYD